MLDISPQTTTVGTSAHPLDPLTAEEIEATSAIVKAATGDRPELRFVTITLREPVRGSSAATAPPREAFCVLYDRGERLAYEAVIDLSAGQLVSNEPVPDAQPPVMMEEFFLIVDLVKEHPDWQEALHKRGVTDFSLAIVEPWPAGFIQDSDVPANGRLIRPLTFVRASPEDNPYARPVEGLIVDVDLDNLVVLGVRDYGVVPLPPLPGNWETDLMTDPENIPYVPEARTGQKPLSITQPEGASFTVDGWKVDWQKWNLRVGFTPREGLVLYDLAYQDGGRNRSLFHRLSLAEMFVPYGDPSPTHFNKNVFDEGEVGMGLCANALELGCDCLGEIYYFSTFLNDQDGKAVAYPNAICMHEEDYGVALKHTDFRSGRGEVRRSRRLVISFFSTVGNYDYGYFWYLYNDGAIEFEIKLNGIMSVGAIAEGETPEFGNLVAPGLFAPNHQHFFNVRMDVCLDGPNNSVYEVDTVQMPRDEKNPWGNAWKVQSTLLETEQQAQRMIDPFASRTWKIVNPSSANRMGQPVGYKIIPMENAIPYLHDDSYAGQRARFAFKHLWVTKYEDGELFAAGDYPWQSPGGEGLPKYIAADDAIVNTDVVLWYTMGHTHVARLEDWPLMPNAKLSFWMKPVGFFDGNPAADLPKPAVSACHAAGGCACSGQGPCTCS